MKNIAVADHPFARLDGLGLAEIVHRKEVTPKELLDWAIGNVAELNPTLNCIAHRHDDAARAQIVAGLPDGPFRGVPFLIKDLGVELAGTVTSLGSRAWLESPPSTSDSELIARYKRAGLVIFGKTTSPELGITFTTESKAFGLTRNPWDLTRTPGGSSGGAASAVASGIVPMAHGSDGGGSIRTPASCTGLFGLKPSRGRTPSGPKTTEPWLGLLASHALTRSVRDSAALLDATAGPELGARSALPPPRTGSFLGGLERPPERLRIGCVATPPTGVPVDIECTRAMREAARLCESLGHHVEEVNVPLEAEALDRGFLVLLQSLVAQMLRDRGLARGRPVTAEEVETVTWMHAEQGALLPALALADANDAFQRAAIAVARLQTHHDVLLSPTLAKPPIPLGVLGLSPTDMEAFRREMAGFSPFTWLANMTGQPSMSVPLHWSPTGLPIGVMFTGRFGEEGTLLRLARQLEVALPWFDRRPTQIGRPPPSLTSC